MKYIIIILFTVFGLSTHSSVYAQQSETVDITVTITNVNSQKGIVRMGIFNNSKDFLSSGKEYKTQTKKPSGDTLVFYFKDLPKDDYAVSLYHDINSDNKCNLSFLFRPTEPYGFSNNVKLKLFKPNFDDCKFTADKDMEVKITLID